MWVMIPSLVAIVDDLKPVFMQPSFGSCAQLLLAWVMCLGKHTLLRVARNVNPEAVPDHTQRHGLDSYFNFFERSAWTPKRPQAPEGPQVAHPQGGGPEGRPQADNRGRVGMASG